MSSLATRSALPDAHPRGHWVAGAALAVLLPCELVHPTASNSIAVNPASSPAGPSTGPATEHARGLAAQRPAANGPTAADRSARDTQLATCLQAAAAGNTRAFESFYDATLGYARALARRMVRPADLDDLLADAFFQVWREASRFDPLRGSAVTWLLTVVRSRALDLLRHQRASPEVEPASANDDSGDTRSDPQPGPEALLAGTEAGTRLHAALANLSANERWVLGLAYYRELSHSEISATTGMPLGTVKSLILRAQARLREQLAAE